MKKKNSFFGPLATFILFFIVNFVNSQTNDAALWQNIYLEKKITPRINFHVNEEGRINQNITRFYYIYADIGATYKLSKHFFVMGDYVFIEKRRRDDYWSTHHQAYIALIFKQNIGSFKISDRFMSQIDLSDIYSSKLGMLPNYHLRNKITIKYNHNSRFTYYIASEMYYKINSYYKRNLPKEGYLDRMRYFAGFFYELNKRSSVELYYLFENNFNRSNGFYRYNAANNFVIGIGYEHKF